MALRQLDIVLRDGASLDLGEEDDKVMHRWDVPTGAGDRLHALILRAENAEAVMDCLRDRDEVLTVVARAVESVIPRADEDEEDDVATEEEDDEPPPLFARVSREEIRQRVDSAGTVDGPFVFLVVASTIVAAVGLALDNTAVVIGAMVIAPLVGPNLLLALSTSLVDWRMGVRAVIVNGTGSGLAFALAAGIGLIWQIDGGSSEIVLRTQVTLADVALALAAGAAGALSITRAVNTALIGVMVAAALLPPVVVSGLLLGSGQWEDAASAGLMYAVNLVCVNLAAVATFVMLGLKPRLWADRQDSGWVVPTAVALWVSLLLTFVGLMWWLRGWDMLLLSDV